MTSLAEPFAMSLPAISKHLKVLENAGLIVRSREAQWRPCRLDGGAAQGRGRLAGALPQFLGAELRSPGGPSAGPARRRRSDVCRRNIDATATANRELVVTRIIDAPRRLVFKRVDGARAGGSLVGTAGLRHDLLRHGHPARWRIPLLHAIGCTAPTTGSAASIARSSNRSASSSPSPGRMRTAIPATNC